MWTRNNEWIIKSHDKTYAKISKNDTCPDFPYSKDWRVNMHGQWKNDIGLRIKAKSETCTAGMRHYSVTQSKLSFFNHMPT